MIKPLHAVTQVTALTKKQNNSQKFSNIAISKFASNTNV